MREIAQPPFTLTGELLEKFTELNKRIAGANAEQERVEAARASFDPATSDPAILA